MYADIITNFHQLLLNVMFVFFLLPIGLGVFYTILSAIVTKA